jgi:hypothetical protein
MKNDKLENVMWIIDKKYIARNKKEKEQIIELMCEGGDETKEEFFRCHDVKKINMDTQIQEIMNNYGL